MLSPSLPISYTPETQHNSLVALRHQFASIPILTFKNLFKFTSNENYFKK